MKLRIFISTIAALALAATAFAQDFAQGDTTNPPSLIQTITIEIPPRLALHLTETAYTLDLDNLAAYDPIPGQTIHGPYNWPTAEGCMMLPKGQEAGILNAPSNPAPLGQLFQTLFNVGSPVANYPAVVLDGGNVAVVGGEYQKGTLVCFNQKTVQKFANVPWKLSADVNIDGNIGMFGIVDDVDASYVTPWDGRLESDYRYLLTGNASGLLLAQHKTNTTQGWLDDAITEVFWFDGTEMPGTHTVTVTYTLTNP